MMVEGFRQQIQNEKNLQDKQLSLFNKQMSKTIKIRALRNILTGTVYESYLVPDLNTPTVNKNKKQGN